MDYNLFKGFSDQIESRLDQIHETTPIPVFNHKQSMRDLDYKWLYGSEKYCLPYHIQQAIPSNRVDRFYFEIFFNAIKDEHPTLVSSGVNDAIDKAVRECYPPETLHMALSSKFMNLTYEYNKVLAVTKERDFLQGIYGEDAIIINHLNRYYEILNSTDTQIDISNGLSFSKEISDLFLKALIRFLENRLCLLKPQLNNVNELKTKVESKSDTPFRFIWNGSQKDLLELIVTLQKNSWINEIPKNQLSQAGKAICNFFDINATKKSSQSDPTNSFVQILKGEINGETQQRDYTNYFHEEYDFKFKEIKNNRS